MKRNLLKNMTAAMTALFAITFALPQTAQAQSLKIDDTSIDLSTSKDLTGDWLESGKMHWDAATKTLTLDNATLVSDTDDFIYLNGELTIALIGSNSINVNNKYVAFHLINATCTINGSGSLKVRSSWMPIYLDRHSTLTLDGCEVETTKEIGNNNSPVFDNHLVVKNATLKTPYINRMKSITLIDCHIQSPEGGKIIDAEINESMGQKVVDANGEYPSNGIVIVPGNTTSITQPEASATATVQEIYSLDGSRQSRMQRGVNIVKMSDGTTRKVVCRQ